MRYTLGWLSVLIAGCGVGLGIESTETYEKNEPQGPYGFSDVSHLHLDGYEFVFDSVESDDGVVWGLFRFKWNGTRPIRLSAFWPDGMTSNDLWEQVVQLDEEKENSFTARFESYSKIEGGKWTEQLVGYCGTGAMSVELAPNTDYVIRARLPRYIFSGGETGVVKLYGQNLSVVSTPFRMPHVNEEPQPNRP